jgi:hypothetical protein
MGANPTWPTVSLDIKNAFGAVTWDSAMRIAETECPQLGLIKIAANKDKAAMALISVGPRPLEIAL